MTNINESCEPMDIDLSANSVYNMDISYDEPNIEFIEPLIKKENTSFKEENISNQESPAEVVAPTRGSSSPKITTIKKFHINIQSKPKKVYTLEFFISILLILIPVVTYHVLNFSCSEELNTENLRLTLEGKLVGQSNAIDNLIETLEKSDKRKILYFYGGTGVGKTFATSLIMESLGYASNIYHYTMPSFGENFSSDYMLGLTVCKHSIIVVDDLFASDTHIIKHVNEIITKSENLDKNITIILIYNCDTNGKDFMTSCDESFQKKLFEDYKDIRAYKKFIKFDPLMQEHLKMCIQYELGHKKLTETNFNRILKHFNVTSDGCKGITKVKFLEIL